MAAEERVFPPPQIESQVTHPLSDVGRLRKPEAAPAHEFQHRLRFSVLEKETQGPCGIDPHVQRRKRRGPVGCENEIDALHLGRGQIGVEAVIGAQLLAGGDDAIAIGVGAVPAALAVRVRNAVQVRVFGEVKAAPRCHAADPRGKSARTQSGAASPGTVDRCRHVDSVLEVNVDVGRRQIQAVERAHVFEKRRVQSNAEVRGLLRNEFRSGADDCRHAMPAPAARTGSLRHRTACLGRGRLRDGRRPERRSIRRSQRHPIRYVPGQSDLGVKGATHRIVIVVTPGDLH